MRKESGSRPIRCLASKIAVKSLFYVVSETFDALVSRYPVVMAAVAAIFLSNAISIAGPLEASSRRLDDLLMRYAPASLPESRVLIVEIQPETFTALTHAEHSKNPRAMRELTLVVRRLREFGARQIAIGLLPAAAPDLISDALIHDDVLFGRRYSSGNGSTSADLVHGTLEVIPDEYRALSNRFGVLRTPESSFGVSRTQILFSQVGHQVLPSLESLLASRSGGHAMPFDQGPLRIDFRGEAHRLPTLDFERIVSGDLLESLVKDRAVLIGLGADPFTPGISTPRSVSGGLSEFHYRGYVLDTLLRGSGLSRSLWISFALTVCASLLGARLGQSLSFRIALSVSSVASFGYIVAAWFSLGLFGFHLPVLEPIAAQPMACAFVLLSRQVVSRGELRRAARRTTALVHTLPDLPVRPSALNSKWHRLSRLLTTSVGVERLLFLEISEDGNAAHEIFCVGCELDSERSHDLSDAPFAEAMNTNAALEITEPLFEPASPRSAQFMLPLSDGGRWLGLCIVESATYGPEHEDVTLRALRELGGLAGRLLAEWSRTASADALPREQTDHDPRQRISDGEARRLETNAEMLYRRIGTLQKIVEDGSVASAVFDLSGYVSQSNTRMQSIATEYGLTLTEVEPATFMSELTGIDLERTRSMLRRVLIDDRKHVVAIRPLHGEHTRTLHLSPLKRPTAEIEDPSHPFPLQGVLIEIIDDEVAHQFHRHRARVVPIAHRANLEISRLAESIDKLERENDFDAAPLALLAKSAGDAVTAIREDLANPPQLGDSAPSLFEASEPLERAAEEHLAECTQRGISVVFDRPERPVFIKAPEAAFYDLLEASVSLLVRDAMDSSTLILQIVEGPTRIEYDLRNQGYGMPSNILRKGLSEVDDGSLADLTRIRRALPESESVGADFTIHSEVGEGISIGLSMPRAL